MYQGIRFIMILAVVAFTWAASVCAFAEETMPGKAETSGDCGACHSSATPSKDDLFPKNCSRTEKTEAAKADSAPKAPDVFILDKLSDIYVPVVFPHKLHASMEAMADGCTVCHHHSPPGKTLACSSCHNGDTNPQDLRQPGLKGAYHRQCLSCHREWSHDTDCSVCHAKRRAGQIAPKPDSTDILGSLHPKVETPDKFVYKTPGVDPESMVTFHHKEHTALFGKRCVDCHKKENCSHCHDAAAPQQKHVRQDPHEDCTKCHEISEDCSRCHKQEEPPGFNHLVRTTFPLKGFHKDLACQKCHGTSGSFKGLKPSCASCHNSEWFPDNFDHAKTGVTLDELHSMASCNMCHIDGLGKPAQCKGCHDDGRKFPESPSDTTTQDLSKAVSKRTP